MPLNEIRPARGAKHARKRVGRGFGSHGKTAGRGHKGQKSRSGGFHKIGFEGGQMPLQRRLPKRGFSRARFKVEVQNVNLADLARFREVREFDRERMAALGLIDLGGGPVKVLARGKLERAVTVRADAFSEAARVAIEAAGGSVETTEGDA